MGVTIENAIARIKNNGNNPLFVNVNSEADYCSIRQALPSFRTFKLTSYFEKSMPLPDVDKMMADIKLSTTTPLVLGLSEYLAFKDSNILSQVISDIGKSNRRVIVLCSHLKAFLMECINKDIRYKDRVIIVDGVQNSSPTLTLSAFAIQSDSSFKTLKDCIASIEEKGCQSAMVVSGLSLKIFEQGYWSVKTIASAYDALCFEIANFDERFHKEFATEEQWQFLYDELKDNKILKSISLRNFGVKEPERAIIGYFNLSDNHKLLLLYLLKSSSEKNYVTYVARTVNSTAEMPRQLYCYLLDLNKDNELFYQFYNERRELIKSLLDDAEMLQFINLADAKGKDKIYYLTDLTEIERKEVVKCIIKFKYKVTELRSILMRIYPFLADYLSSYFFGKPFLDEYFERYKIQKLTNKIEEEFIELVNTLASEKPRKFIVELPTRSMALTNELSEYPVIWIDALGAEFLGFISRRCDALGLKADIKVARAEMPTLTGFNKEFFNESRGDKKVEDLDKLKHSGVGEYDYSKTPLPLYIVRELEIIEEVLRKAKAQIANEQKPVLIISDHGASRLVRIYEHTIPVDAEVDGKHGGRCCIWEDGLSNISPYASDNENGYCVLANYDRFIGSKYTGVELHGGATLEEVVVPIIKLSLKNALVTYKLSKMQYSVRRGKADLVSITLSSLIKKLRLKIGEKYFEPIKIENTTYTFETDINRPDIYQAVLLDDNQVIDNVKLEFKSAIGDIKDIL